MSEDSRAKLLGVVPIATTKDGTKWLFLVDERNEVRPIKEREFVEGAQFYGQTHEEYAKTLGCRFATMQEAAEAQQRANSSDN